MKVDIDKLKYIVKPAAPLGEAGLHRKNSKKREFSSLAKK